ncbi:MAG: helix-turn-helix domain-containing protein [Fusobacterium sp.]|nr:helix-turn-helix domain-containing protein [Fusobacterium sp.]
MQEQYRKKLEKNKKLVNKALAKTIKELRGDKSLFILGSESDIPLSVLSTVERGIKDPQLTTVFRLAEAFDLSIIEFLEKVCQKLPENFEMLDK